MSKDEKLVVVYTGTDSVELIMAKLALDGEGIRYVSGGEGVQDLFGIGRVMGGFNHVTGPVKLRVLPEDAPVALEAIREMQVASDGDAAEGDADATGGS